MSVSHPDSVAMQRRVDLLAAEGIVFRPGVEVGKDVDVKELHAANDAVLLTVGATWPRDLTIPGRELDGIHFAMDFLTPTTKVR
jgi:glutamate synthase (NADPH/NADH)